MARKLLCVVALISLVFLIEASPGLATTYNLALGNATYYAWTEAHGTSDGNPDFIPGNANGSFNLFDMNGFANNNFNSQYRVCTISNPDPGKVISSDANSVTYQITYVSDANTSAPIFYATGYSGPEISAVQFMQITTTATYVKGPDGLPLYALGTDGIDHYTLADANQDGLGTMTMTGYGETLGNTWFRLDGAMIESHRDGQHSGYFSTFTLAYDVPPPSHAPIPGAVWLLGTGLLGLGCVGWRRKA